ncbi:hypothetical protein Tco_0675665 [Tanacetum coccineum]
MNRMRIILTDQQQKQQQQIIPADQLVPKLQGIGRCNNYVVLQNIPCCVECKITRQILIDHALSYALTATANVLAVYLQQFWKTVSKIVGYQGDVDKVNAFFTKCLAQLWQTIFKENLMEEDIEKIVEGEDEESYASEFADSVFLNEEDDFGSRIEPESHRKNLKVVDDNDIDDNVDKTQSTQFEESVANHNKDNTSSKVEPVSNAHIIASLRDFQELIEDFDEELKGFSDEEILDARRHGN